MYLSDRRNCLHLAASTGNLQVVEELLRHGVQVNARDRWGGTALADAMRGGHAMVSRTLRDHGAELRLELQPYVPELLPCASRLQSYVSRPALCVSRR